MLLAIGNVIFKILPYFIIADIVKLFLNGEKEFEIYLAKAVDVYKRQAFGLFLNLPEGSAPWNPGTSMA